MQLLGGGNPPNWKSRHTHTGMYLHRQYRGYVRSPTRQELQEKYHPKDIRYNWLTPWYFRQFAPSTAYMLIIMF